jgi:hypothetical protein
VLNKAKVPEFLRAGDLTSHRKVLVRLCALGVEVSLHRSDIRKEMLDDDQLPPPS